MLTEKQSKLLYYINTYQCVRGGVSPSFDEMVEHLELKSKSPVHGLLKRLESRGFIKRVFNEARAIEILKLPEPNTCPHCGEKL